MANIKICSKCGKVGLDQIDFDIYWDKRNGKYYYRGRCRECVGKNYKQYKKEWDQNNKEHIKEYHKQYHKDNLNKAKAQKRKNRVRKAGAEGTHTIQDLKYIYDHQQGICGKCRKYISFDKMTVDHIVPLTWGGSNYPSNIQLLCHSCNSSKGNRHNTDYRDYIPLFLE